jgi:hypothetical protein
MLMLTLLLPTLHPHAPPAHTLHIHDLHSYAHTCPRLANAASLDNILAGTADHAHRMQRM